MARIRTIKPEFFDDPKMGKSSPLARLAFLGLLTQADSKGRIEDEPERLKVRLLPYDEVNMDAILSELASLGVILRYDADIKRVIQITNFEKHQRPHPKEAPSLLPAPAVKRNGKPRKDTASREKPERAVKINALSGSLDSGSLDSGDWTLEAGGSAPAPVPEPEAAAPPAPRPADLQTLWNATTTPPIPRCLDLSDPRRAKLRLRLREHPLDWWRTVVARIEASAFCRGQNDRGWTATFDWLIDNQDNALKVLEGKYDNRALTTTAAPRISDEAILADIAAQKALRQRGRT